METSGLLLLHSVITYYNNEGGHTTKSDPFQLPIFPESLQLTNTKEKLISASKSTGTSLRWGNPQLQGEGAYKILIKYLMRALNLSP